MNIHKHIRNVVALLLFMPMLAQATLGQRADTVGGNQELTKFKAALPKAISGSYTLHRLQLPSGTSVREYADEFGIVFAVAWDGPTKPDLNQLLGRYFTEYESGAGASTRRHRNHMVVRKFDFVIQSEGRMRAFRGKAYLPQSIPVGVSIEELK